MRNARFLSRLWHAPLVRWERYHDFLVTSIKAFLYFRKLCFRAPDHTRRFLALEKFTPKQVREDESRTWRTTKIFYGGKRRGLSVRLSDILRSSPKRKPSTSAVAFPKKSEAL